MTMRLAVLVMLCWLVVAPTGARAEPISISILTTVGIQATATAIAATTFALTTAASFAVSYLHAAFTKKSAAPEALPVGGSSGRLSTGGVVPRSVVVGAGLAEGSLVYHNSFGEHNKSPNAIYVQVIALSDLPVTGLRELWVNGAKVTYDPDNWAELTAPGVNIPEFVDEHGQWHLAVRFYDGTQTEADAILVGQFGTDPDRPYGADRVGYGVAYMVVTAVVNDKFFSGFPQCKAALNGVKLYDRRYDSTNGGDGPQRANDDTTWAFTENPAVIRENVLRGLRYDGQWQWGGKTIGGAQLPAGSWVAAANECDLPVDLAEGGTEPQFRAGGVIRFDMEPADVLEALCKADNGRVAENGGVYKTRSGPAGAAVFAFTDRDILTDKARTFDPFPGQEGQTNHVTARYLNPAEGWALKDAPALADAALEALDGRRIATSAEYGFVTSGTQVQRLMRAERDSVRAWRRHALPMPPDAQLLEPLDVVTWSSVPNGYADKALEVITLEDLSNANVGMALKELDPAAYNWTPATDERPVSDGTISILRPPAQAVILPFALPHKLNVGGREIAAILVGWDPAQPDVDGVRLQVRLKATEALQLDTEEGAAVFARGSAVVSQNIAPATLYQARVQYRPASPRTTLWSAWMDVLTDDVRVERPDLSPQLDASVRRLEVSVSQEFERVRAQMRAQAGALGALGAGIFESQNFIRMAAAAQFGENKASIEKSFLTLATQDEALAAMILLLQATAAGHTVQISDEIVARAAGDAALAARIIRLLATGPDGSAEGLFRIITSSTPAGAVASIALEVNLGTPGTPTWKNIGWWADAMSAGGGFGRIRQRADLHAWEAPGVNGGAPFNAFTVSGSEIVATVLMRVQAFVAQSVNTAALAINGVTFDRVLEGAIGQRASYNTIPGNGTLLNHVSFTVLNAARRVNLKLNIPSMTAVSGTLWSDPPPFLALNFYVDGGLHVSVPVYATSTSVSGANTYWAHRDSLYPYSCDYATLSAGAHTFGFAVDSTTGGWSSVNVPAGTAVLTELSK